MKKILFTLLIAIFAMSACVAQSKFKKGIVVGDASNTVIDSIDKVGEVAVVYMDGAYINAYNDSIAVLQTALTAAKLRISTLEGADITPPYVDSAYINAANDSLIYILFNEDLSEDDNDSVTNAFSFTYGATSLTAGSIDSVAVGGNYAFIYSGINIPSDSIVYVTYTKPSSKGLHDLSANYTYDFTKRLVFNGTTSAPYVADGFWKFNGNLNDFYGAYNGSAIGTIGYTGDTAIIFSEADGNDAVNIGDMITSNDFSFAYWLLLDEDASEFYYIAGNAAASPADGWQHYVSGNGAGGGLMVFRTANGVASTTASGGNFTVDTWHHVVGLVDRIGNGTNAYCKMYLDGVLINDADTILSAASEDFAISGQDIYVGNHKTPGDANGLREGAIMGEFVVFNERLSTDQIDSLYAVGGDAMWNVSTPSTPPSYDDTDYTIVESYDFTGEVLGTWTEAEVESYFDGTVLWYNPSPPPASISIIDSDTVLDVYIAPVAEAAGIGLEITIPSANEYWFSYNIKFPAGFDWSNGGKLPGLGGSDYGSSTVGHGNGKSDPDCTEPTADPYLSTWGFSGRMGYGSRTNENVRPYVYHHNMPWPACPGQTWGETLGNPLETITRGVWYNITIRVVQNTVTTEGLGNNDGIYEFYWDGELLAVESDWRFRNYLSMGIDAYILDIFTGGGSDATRTTSSNIYVDDFRLWNWGPNSSEKKGNNANTVGHIITPPGMDEK